jgi:hypothetical protein
MVVPLRFSLLITLLGVLFVVALISVLIWLGGPPECATVSDVRIGGSTMVAGRDRR